MKTLMDADDVKPVRLRPSSNLLMRKLSHFVNLSDLDEKFLDTLALPDQRLPAHANISVEGGSGSGFLIKEGTAIRYRDLPDGGRQIMTFLIPGDLCDGHVFLIKTMDYSISTITPVRIAPVSHETMMEIFSYRRRIFAAIWWSWLQEQAILRERIVSLGRRDARGRVAYLLCELLWRYAAVGLAEGGRFRLPLTQAQLGDALGLTSVRINHVLKEFKARSLLSLEHRLVHVLDLAALQCIAGLSLDYLQLGGAPGAMAPYLTS